MWKRCGCLRGTRCPHAEIERERRRAMRRADAAIAEENRRIEAGNRRRRQCLEKVLEWCMRGDLTRARVWVAKLAAAGFDAKDAREMEAMPLEELERTVRRTLGIAEVEK